MLESCKCKILKKREPQYRFCDFHRLDYSEQLQLKATKKVLMRLCHTSASPSVGPINCFEVYDAINLNKDNISLSKIRYNLAT